MDFALPPLHILAQATLGPEAIALLSASAISAAGLALLMQPGRKSGNNQNGSKFRFEGLRIAGTVIALAGFAMLLVEVIKRAASDGESASIPPVFPMIFGTVALARLRACSCCSARSSWRLRS